MKKTKRFLTLIELMIVILLIGLIGGAIAYNMSGSLSSGKKFTTEQYVKQIQNALEFYMSENGVTGAAVAADWQNILTQVPFVKDATKIQKDAWGEDFTVTYDATNGFVVTSANYP